ncbi:MAG: KdsC family phosphatase [Gemmatimonadales bacterium]
MLQPIVAKRIQLVGLDVDGVMTDGGVYMGEGPDGPTELKRFDIQDTIGIKLLMTAELEVVIVSGRFSEATKIRAEELGIRTVIQDPKARKLAPFEQLLKERDLRMDQAAFLGDDLTDLPLLRRVGIPAAVQNAVAEVRELATVVTTAAGGHGAVREFAELLLKARGQWDDVVRKYLVDRGDTSQRLSSA